MTARARPRGAAGSAASPARAPANPIEVNDAHGSIQQIPSASAMEMKIVAVAGTGTAARFSEDQKARRAVETTRSSVDVQERE